MVVMPLPPCLPSAKILGCSWLLVPPCLPSFSPFMISFLGCFWLPSPKLVSLHDSLLGCSWLPLPPCLPSLSPFMISLWAALGWSPFMILLLGCSWLQLPPCPFMISLLGCSWLPLPPCVPSLCPFMISLPGCSGCLPSCLSGLLLAAAAALSPKLVSLHDFCSGLLWLPLPHCLPSLSPFMLVWAALGCRCRLVSQACLPS